MKRLLGALLCGSALGLTACGGEESDANQRTDLLEHVERELEQSGASAAMVECTADELDRRLDLAPIKAAYDELPDDASDAEVARVLRDSSLNEDIVASVSVCASRLGRWERLKP
jgi:hypothetical protein